MIHRQLLCNITRFIRVFGTSRDSALAALRSVRSVVPVTTTQRVVSLFAGALMIGVAVGLMVQANLGLAPYDVLSSGLSRQLGLSLGQAGWVMATLLFAVASILGRRPSLWGIAYMFTVGVAVDAVAGVVNQPVAIGARTLCVGIAVVLMAAGINVVLHSGTTGGPFELLMYAGEDRGVNPMTVRYVLDVGVLLGGIALGGSFGPATVVYASLMGFVLHVVRQALEDHRQGRALRTRVATAVEPIGIG